MAKLKQQDGKPILAHDGAGFARSLIATGLVDAFQLLVIPTVLGKGLPIFTDVKGPMELKLVEAKPFPKGWVGHIYRPG